MSWQGRFSQEPVKGGLGKCFERFFHSTPDEANTDAQRLVTLLRESPAMGQLQAEREQARVSKSRELLEQREQLERSRNEAMPRLRAATAQAKAREQEWREKLQKATQESARCTNEEAAASARFKCQIDAIDSEIIKLAPAAIDTFKRELLRLFDETRLQTQDQTSAPHWFTGERTTVTNSQTLAARLAGIRDALTKAEALKLEALSEVETIQRLDQLRESVLQIGSVDQPTLKNNSSGVYQVHTATERIHRG